MFPIGDDREVGGSVALVVMGLVALNVVAFLFELAQPSQGALQSFIQAWGVVPHEYVGRHDLPPAIPVAVWSALFTSMFLHAGWMHLGGNMLYLWIFGDNLERVMGHGRFLVFYLICGVAAGLAQIVASGASNIPSLGASGAISGVLGGYLVLFPRNRVRVLTRGGITSVPAVVVLGLWIVIQLISGIGSIANTTTTIQMLTTLVAPVSGTIRIDGLDPATHATDVRRRFGIVFQDPSLDGELTAWENMEIHGVLYHVPRRTRHERIDRLLTLFELRDRRDSYVKTFSGGMKRRLEIARGFLHTPKILFLDEPTLGLDPQSRNQLWTHVKSLNETERVTVFLTTHYMDEAERVAGRMAIIDRGKIVAQGSAAELKQQTKTESLEQAFLALTGTTIRDERADPAAQMRQFAKMWRR